MSILRATNSDFSVAEEGSSDLLDSTVDAADLESIRATPGVERAIDVLVATNDLDEDHPLFIEIGIDLADLVDFGVRIVEGRSYGPISPDEAMLGFRAASDLGADVGDRVRFHSQEEPYLIVGIFSTGVSFGDSARRGRPDADERSRARASVPCARVGSPRVEMTRRSPRSPAPQPGPVSRP